MEDIVGSKFKSQRNRGQAQDLTGVTTSEKTLPIIPGIAPPNASADPGSWQTRGVDATPITPAHGMGSAPKAAFPVSGTSPRPSSVAAKPGSYVK
jgi:hypothetical protein